MTEPGAESASVDPTAAALTRDAFALYQKGRIAEACERYEEIAFRIGGEEARRNLGSCVARLGRDASRTQQPQLAIDHYRRSLQADPSAQPVWLALIHAHTEAGDSAAAERAAEWAARNFPSEPEVLYLLAQLRERRGRTREAIETLRQLLRLQPKHSRGQRLLATLEREEQFEGSYWSEESRHFVVRYEGAKGIDVGRSVIGLLEDAYDSLGRDLSVYPTERLQVGIYTPAVLGQVLGFPAHYVRGAYDMRKIRLNLGESRAYSDDLSRLVRHEYAHTLIHLATRGRAPIWLHEGLAQVMEPRAAPRFVEVSVPREALTLQGIQGLARSGSLEGIAVGYMLTHVAAEYLLQRGGLSSMRDFLDRLGRGQPLPGAMRAAFGFGPEEVESRLRTFMGKS